MTRLTGNALGGMERLKGFAARAVFLILFVTSMAFAVLPTQANAQSYRFTQVEINGNQRVDGATILTYAGINRGETVSAAALNQAYQNIINSGLFENVLITPRGNTLVIEVEEYPTINVINFEGNRRIGDDVLSTIVQSQSRRVYSPTLAEQDAATLVQAYQQEGRLAATVTPKIIRRSNNRVDLVFEIVEGDVIEIERLSFIGNRAYSERRLRRVLETKQAGLLRSLVRADTFIADRIEFDKQVLRDFYMSRGYIDFQVLSVTSELTRSRDAFLIAFNIQEGQQFTFGEVTVSSDLPQIDPDVYLDALDIKSGKAYSPSIVENNLARLERLAVQQGVDFVRVDPRVSRNDRDLTLDVEFVVSRGERVFVERIDIEGNSTTLDRVIRRQFDTVEGDPFNARQIRETAERIRALGFFSNVSVEAREGSTPSDVIVDVDVEEQPTGSLSFGLSYSVTNGAGLTAGFTERNFLGRGQFLSFQIGTASDNANSEIVFAEPAFLGRDVRFRFAARYAVSDNQDSFQFQTRNISISPSLEFPTGEYGRVGVRYTLGQDDVFNYTGASTIIAADVANDTRTKSALGYSLIHDTRGRGLDPNSGILLRFNQDFGVGGDVDYIETTALLAAETKVLNEEVTLRAEFEGGLLHMLNGNSRITDRYFLNGKIRGFENNGVGPRDLSTPSQEALGGNMFAVARFEAEFPIGVVEEYGISGGLFADFGTVWSLDNDGGFIDDSLNLRSSVGVSVFWDTALGPLRFNFSRALAKQSYDRTQNFDLTISTRF